MTSWSGIDGLDELGPLFLAEGARHLASLERVVVGLEGEGSDPRSLAEARRAMHTLRGSAAQMGFGTIAEAARDCEEALDATAGASSSSDTAVQLRRSANAISEMLDAISSSVPADDTGAVDLQGRLEGGQNTDSPLAADPWPSIRELSLTVAQLDHLAQAVRNGPSDAGSLQAARIAVRELRSVEIGKSLRQFAEPLRVIAANAGKHVCFVAECEDVWLDLRIAHALLELLPHLLRHAVDRELECARSRVLLGKPSFGTITVRVTPADPWLAIRVSDDGAGYTSHEEDADDAAIQRWVRAHGGVLRRESRAGAGTTVHVRIPLHPEESAVTSLHVPEGRSATELRGVAAEPLFA